MFYNFVDAGGEGQFRLLTDFGAADDQPDPVRLVEAETHVWLELGRALLQHKGGLVVIVP